MIGKIALAKLAFVISVCLSLLLGALQLFNVKALPKQSEILKIGEDVMDCFSQLQEHEQAYLLYRQEGVLEDVREAIEKLRKSMAQYEDLPPLESREGSWGVDIFEAMDIYERLFDQLVMYHKAEVKNLSEIQELEEDLLAIIFSKMTPERGIIALQEIRIVEKEYLLMRNHLKNTERSAFLGKRKTGVANLLMWAQKDKRIEELMRQDTKLFDQIIKSRVSQNDTLLALQKEREKVYTLARTFMENERRRLVIASNRILFLCVMLLVMWSVTGLALVAAKAGEKT